MITKFKIFEKQEEKNFLDEDDLMELFSQDFIEEYFDENYEVSEEDAARMLNLWNYVNLDDVRDNLIEELAGHSKIKDKKYTKRDFIDYIKTMDDIDINLEELKSMSRKELIEIIYEAGESEDFLLKKLKEEYEDVHPEQLLIVIYGKYAIEDDENLLYYLREYLDINEIIEDARDKIDFEYKYDYLKDYICNDENLQKKLLELDPNTIQALFDIMDEDRSIGNTYNFQKEYIDYNVKKYGNDILPKVLKDIYDKYGLDPDIDKEYEEYTYLINAEKYNL